MKKRSIAPQDVRHPLPHSVYEEIGVFPFQELPASMQESINAECELPSPPPRHIRCGEFITMQSRAFFEWHWRRGRMPGQERTKIPRATRARIFERDGGSCAYCGAELTTATMHVDHVIPVSRGGGNNDSNLVASCRPCNLSKGARTAEEWLS